MDRAKVDFPREKEEKERERKIEEYEGEGGFIAGNPRFGSRRNFLEQKYSLGMDSTSGYPEIAVGWREGNGLLSSSLLPSLSPSLSLSFDPVQDTRRFSEIHGFVKRPADKTTNNSQLSFPSLSVYPIYPPALSLWSWRRTRGGGLVVVVQVTAAGACFFFQKGSVEGGRTERLTGWLAAGCTSSPPRAI